MSSSGFPDWQRITQWFSSPVDEGTAVSVNPVAHVAGPFDLLSFASVIVCVKANGGPVTVTVKQSVPGGPASLTVSSSFVVAAGNVLFEGIVLEAGTVEVDFASASGGATVDYAIVPSNVNTNVAGSLLTQLGFQHNEAAIANETNVSFDDTASVTFAVVDDPPNARAKVTATAAVTSVFGRTGVVVATSGDYTAAQVTNAADKSSAAIQAFTAPVSAAFTGNPGTTGLALATNAITVTSGHARITTTDGTTLTKINGRPSNDGWHLHLVNATGSNIPYGTGGGAGIGISSAGTLLSGNQLDLVFDPSSVVWVPMAQAGAAGAANVVSVFGRVGAVVATTGDYTAAQVTNAADKSSATTQAFTGGVTSASASGGVGYATGAGAPVTQLTSRTTGVTINNVCGQITTNATSLAAGAVATFTVTNSRVAATDTIVLTLTNDAGLVITYRITSVAAGSFIISYTNTGGVATTTAYVFNFAILKSVAA